MVVCLVGGKEFCLSFWVMFVYYCFHRFWAFLIQALIDLSKKKKEKKKNINGRK